MRMTVRKTSMLPAPKTEVFQLLQRLDTLRYIARPYASFEPIGNAGEIIWKARGEYALEFRLFCFIPLGVHAIKVRSFDADGRICTNEGILLPPFGITGSRWPRRRRA